MTRYLFHTTNLSERNKILSMWFNGMSTRSIAREVGVSPSTVCRWINRWKQEWNVFDRPRAYHLCYARLAMSHVYRPYITVLHISTEMTGSEALTVVQTVISSQPQHGCPVLLLFNSMNQLTLQSLKLGQLWHCLVVMVVSDDQTFLVTFAHLSFKQYALMWKTRSIILTRLPHSQLRGLHALLSNRNVMLLRPLERRGTLREIGVYVESPYSDPSTARPRRVATWRPNTTWTPDSSLQFFPEKFMVWVPIGNICFGLNRLSTAREAYSYTYVLHSLYNRVIFWFSPAPTLKVAIELLPYHRMSWEEDPSVPEGRRLHVTGSMDETVKYLAQAMNFTYRYVLSPERTFGSMLPNGSWTGMMGMVVREEAQFATGPFSLSPVRVSAADYTVPFWTGSLKIVGGLGGIEIDQRGFLLPFTFLVWICTLTALLGVLVLLLIRSHLPDTKLSRGGWSADTLSCVRVLLQQDIELSEEWWWWERLLIGVWMLMTLVLTKSYSGNLMSLLAVRHVPQPFQSIRDVLNDPHVGMIWQKYSRTEEFLRSVQSGIFREVAELEDEGRLTFHTQAQYLKSFNTLVRAGDHVLVDGENTIKRLIALDFSQKGHVRGAGRGAGGRDPGLAGGAPRLPRQEALPPTSTHHRVLRWPTSLPQASRGIAVFEANGANLTGTHPPLSAVFRAARKLRVASQRVVVAVVSEDSAFLAAFAEWSMRSRLLVWSTRLLVLTRLQLTRVQHLHKALSFTNSLLLTPHHGRGTRNRLRVSVVLPYSKAGSEPLVVATWTADRGLTLTSHLPLFPQKFDK
ncbi:Glutamate receptor [Portunus trituberculatus]|uniref:Glutamate receptor n=1 Tax=Portunus trituberculatus TaxID=210409 RepID=A0A5B7D9X6_PORTR|nr:Glutamate receptor [Portunus trituberculatus]